MIGTQSKQTSTDTEESKLGKRKSRTSEPFISDEVFQLAKEKSKAHRNGNKAEYKRLKKEVRIKLR